MAADMQIRVTLTDLPDGGADVGYNYAFSKLDLENITPYRGPYSMDDRIEMMHRAELRKRLVDSIAANIAHALTNVLLHEKD